MTRRSQQAIYRRQVKEAVQKYYPFYLVHAAGCQGVCFYLKYLPSVEDAVCPDDVIYPDGKIPSMSEEPQCFSCKQKLTHEDIQPEHVRRMQ